MRTVQTLVAIGIILTLLLAGCSGPDAGGGNTFNPPTSEVSNPTQTRSPDAGTWPPTATPTAPANQDQGQQPPATPTDGPSNDPSPTQVPPAETPADAPTDTPPPPPPPPTATVTQAPQTGEDGESLLATSRVLSYYGHPSTGTMGILGEYSKEDLLARLQEQAAEFEAADPNTPVKLAFELIATVAQPDPGPDGTYLLYTGDEWIGEYVEFTAANDMLLILDLQIGHNTVRNEIELVRKWLEYPHVHVALDPEFSTGPDRVPGSFIGEVDGNQVQIAMELLSDIARTNNLPNKILIVHQFEAEMIYNKEAITPLPGVDFVLDMDGFGSPEAKIGNYNIFVTQELIEYGGIKLFYQQDAPLIDPATIVGLNPSPRIIIYQ